MAFIIRATSFDPKAAERPLATHMMQQTVEEGRISRGTLRRENDTLTASSRQFHRTGDDMRRLAPLQRPGGPESPRAAGPVMPHLAHNYDFGWRQPDRLPTTEAFYGSGWSSPRAFEIEHVVSRAAHPHLPSHGPRPTLLGARAISLSTHKREHVHQADDRVPPPTANPTAHPTPNPAPKPNPTLDPNPNPNPTPTPNPTPSPSLTQARNAYLRPHTALRRLAAEQQRELVGDQSPRCPTKAAGKSSSPRLFAQPSPRSPRVPGAT